MNHNELAAPRVVAVLLTDGWHRIVPSSFSVGPLGFGASTDLGVPGFRFEESDVGSPYQPTVLAGPLDSIIAVRQVAPAARRVGDLDRARAARYGDQADGVTRRPVRAGR
jgi:hypothetical protein